MNVDTTDACLNLKNFQLIQIESTFLWHSATDEDAVKIMSMRTFWH